MKELPLQDVEGLWRFPANGTIIALERDDDVASRFKIVVVDSPYPSMDPGYLLGYAYSTAKRGVMDATLTEIISEGSLKKGQRKKNRRFTVSLNDNDALSFSPADKGVKISWNWWRLFPYMFRFNIRNVDERQKGLDGALRVWPRSQTIPPAQPRYL